MREEDTVCVGSDGLRYCKVCEEAKEAFFPEGVFMGMKKHSRQCACDRKAYEAEQKYFKDKCYEEGHITMATVVDHIIPHRGDQKLFWDRSNWQPLCEHHHNVKTMTEDRFKEYRF